MAVEFDDVKEIVRTVALRLDSPSSKYSFIFSESDDAVEVCIEAEGSLDPIFVFVVDAERFRVLKALDLNPDGYVSFAYHSYVELLSYIIQYFYPVYFKLSNYGTLNSMLSRVLGKRVRIWKDLLRIICESGQVEYYDRGKVFKVLETNFHYNLENQELTVSGELNDTYKCRTTMELVTTLFTVLAYVFQLNELDINPLFSVSDVEEGDGLFEAEMDMGDDIDSMGMGGGDVGGDMAAGEDLSGEFVPSGDSVENTAPDMDEGKGEIMDEVLEASYRPGGVKTSVFSKLDFDEVSEASTTAGSERNVSGVLLEILRLCAKYMEAVSKAFSRLAAGQFLQSAKGGSGVEEDVSDFLSFVNSTDSFLRQLVSRLKEAKELQDVGLRGDISVPDVNKLVRKINSWSSSISADFLDLLERKEAADHESRVLTPAVEEGKELIKSIRGLLSETEDLILYLDKNSPSVRGQVNHLILPSTEDPNKQIVSENVSTHASSREIENLLLSRMSKRNAIFSMAKVKIISKVTRKGKTCWDGVWEYQGENGIVSVPEDLIKMINISHNYNLYVYNVAGDHYDSAFKCRFTCGDDWHDIMTVEFDWGLTEGIKNLMLEGREKYKCRVDGLSVDFLIEKLKDPFKMRSFLLDVNTGLSNDCRKRILKISV